MDNNSRDDTALVCRQFMGQSIPFTCVLEEHQGLSHARNRAISECSGDIIVYIDDDAVADPGWLAALIAPFESGADAAGGKIIPIWKDGRPWRISSKLDHYFSRYDLGEDTLWSDDVIPSGGNMALRKDLLNDIGGFDPALGLVGDNAGSTLLGEETSVFHAMRERGCRVAYCGRAVVKHWTSPERSSFHGLCERAARQGETAACS